MDLLQTSIGSKKIRDDLGKRLRETTGRDIEEVKQTIRIDGIDEAVELKLLIIDTCL